MLTGTLAIAAVVLAAVLCAGLIVLLRPLLVEYALARPNARSSHTEPTPQGGGVAVIGATIVVAIASAAITGAPALLAGLAPVLCGAMVLAVLGAVVDIKTVAVWPRLLAQLAIVAAVVVFSPHSRLFPMLPGAVETTVLILAGLWFVNLVNFMDGLDLMTVAEAVPIAAAIAVLGAAGIMSAQETVLALGLLGAMLGFAYFNKPIARVFLGDVGSLPIGLMLGWLLLQLAGRGFIMAALLLPLYYLADATLTLVRRLLNGERITEAHRSHFYQRATERKLSVEQIVARVFAANLALSGLALTSIFWPSRAVEIATAACGGAVVALLLRAFSRGRL